MKTLQLGKVTIWRQDKLESSYDIPCVSLSINELSISNVVNFVFVSKKIYHFSSNQTIYKFVINSL